jgi:hypothetical protein
VTIGNSPATGTKTGSTTGGYIDLSGITLTGKPSNKAITEFSTAGTSGNAGNITMVAYQGSGTNSGSIVATATSKQTVGAKTVDATTITGSTGGAIKIIGGGKTIAAQNLNGAAAEIDSSQPIIGGGLNSTITIQNGTVQAGSGNFQVGMVPNTTATSVVGTSTAPISVNAASLSLTSDLNAKSAFITSNSPALSLSGVSLPTGSTFSLSVPGGTLDVTGAVTFAGVPSKGGVINLVGGNGVAIDAPISGAKTATITAATGDITGSAPIQATTVNLNATTGNITATTAAANIAVTAGEVGGTAAITENTTSAKQTNMLNSTLASGVTFQVFSSQQVNVTGKITDIDGFFGVSETGSATPIGINITGTINVGVTPAVGTVALITDSASIIDSKPVTAPAVDILTVGAVGSAAKPFLTNTLDLAVLANSNGTGIPIFLKDANATGLEFSASGSNGGTISLISAAKNLTVDNASYANVTIQDTFAKTGQNASVLLASLNGSAQIGDGFGTVSISSAAANINTSAAGKGISAANISLNSTLGNIGDVSMAVASSALSASAAKGSVTVTDSLSAVLNSGNALNTYTIKASGLTVAGAITGSTVALITTAAGITVDANIGVSKSAHVQLDSANGITQGNAKAVVSGQNVLLQSDSAADIGTPAFMGQNILTKAGTLSLVGKAGTDIYVTQTGAVGVSGSTPSSGSLNLTASGKISIVGNTSFDTLFLVAPSINVVSLSNVTCSVLNAQTNAFVVPSGATVTVNTAADFFGAGALSVTGGSGTITLANHAALSLGGSVFGKPTTSVTLGDSKTGANDPLDASISGQQLQSFVVDTTGNFTSNRTDITVAPPSTTGVAGHISITASNFVSLGSAPFSLIRLTAPGNSSNGGSVTLTLTGSQNVTLSNANGSTSTGTPFELITNSDLSSHAGAISVTTTGSLTALAGGINLRETSVGGSLALISAKSLLVKDTLNNGYANVTIQSGATIPFLVDAGAGLTTNGTIGPVSCSNLTLYSSGIIQAEAPGSITANFTALYVNPTGTLQIIGALGSITMNPTLTTMTFFGEGGVTFGDTKSIATSPFNGFGGLSFLNIDAVHGNFTTPLSNYILANNTVGGTLEITAANIIRYGVSNTIPIVLQAKGNGTFTAGGSVSLTLTGSQAVTLDSTAPASAKQPVYSIDTSGSAGSGSINVQTAGTLTVNPTGITTNAGPSKLTLSGGKGLAIADATLLSGNNIQNVILSSGASTPLVIQSGGPVAPGSNAIIGPVTALKTLQITDQAGITVLSGATINTGAGGTITLVTSKLENDGTVSGGSGSALSIGTLTSPGVTFTTGSSGAYTGFTSLTVQEAGAVNFGNMFTTTSTLSGVLSTLTVDATGSVTLGSTTPSIDMLTGSNLSITAGSLLSKSTSQAIILATTSGSFASVKVATTSAVAIGTQKGNIAIDNLDATTSVLNLESTGGVLTLGNGGGLSVGNGILQGTSVIANQNVTANTNLLVTATGTAGAITTQGISKLTAGILTIGENNSKQPAVGTQISAPTVVIEAGHLGATSLINNFNGNVSVAGAGTAFPIGSLTYIAPSTVTNSTVTLGTLITTSGGININTQGGGSSIATASGAIIQTKGGGINLTVGSASGGTIKIASSSILTTSGGSITLQDNNTTSGSISFATAVIMHASGTAKGVGQVSVVIGPVPTTGLAVGTIPATAPISLTSGTGTITYTTTINPSGTISATGTNVLNAAGRNVVFNEDGLAGSITLAGSDIITADPPVGATGTLVIPALSPASTVNINGISPQAGVNIVAAPTPISPNTSPDFAAALNHSRTAVVLPAALPVRSTTDPLKGKVTNSSERFLEKGPMLIAPEVNTTIHSRFGSVDVVAHSVALIISFDGGIAAYNLHDIKRDSVVIHVGRHHLAVAPGRSAVITNRDVRCFEEVNPAEFVGYRRMTAADYNNGLKIFHGEFDARTMLLGVQPLREMARSGDSRDQKITRSLLKTTAIFMSLGDATPFQYMVAPRMTAMNQR